MIDILRALGQDLVFSQIDAVIKTAPPDLRLTVIGPAVYILFPKGCTTVPECEDGEEFFRRLEALATAGKIFQGTGADGVIIWIFPAGVRTAYPGGAEIMLRCGHIRLDSATGELFTRWWNHQVREVC